MCPDRAQYRVVGSIDAITDEAIYEVKCVSDFEPDLYLQLVMKAWLWLNGGRDALHSKLGIHAEPDDDGDDDDYHLKMTDDDVSSSSSSSLSSSSSSASALTPSESWSPVLARSMFSNVWSSARAGGSISSAASGRARLNPKYFRLLNFKVAHE